MLHQSKMVQRSWLCSHDNLGGATVALDGALYGQVLFLPYCFQVSLVHTHTRIEVEVGSAPSHLPQIKRIFGRCCDGVVVSSVVVNL